MLKRGAGVGWRCTCGWGVEEEELWRARKSQTVKVAAEETVNDGKHETKGLTRVVKFFTVVL